MLPLTLQSDALALTLLPPEAAPLVVDYYRRNAEHLAPWEPRRPASFLSVDHWQGRLAQNRAEAQSRSSLRLFITPPEGPSRVLGSVNFTNLCGGPFLACNLGYSLDGQCQGRSLMRQALQLSINHVFGELGLHRIQANHLPENLRSAALLRRLGFVVEGYARDYLYINGQWRDHVLTALTNPDPGCVPG